MLSVVALCTKPMGCHNHTLIKTIRSFFANFFKLTIYIFFFLSSKNYFSRVKLWNDTFATVLRIQRKQRNTFFSFLIKSHFCIFTNHIPGTSVALLTRLVSMKTELVSLDSGVARALAQFKRAQNFVCAFHQIFCFQNNFYGFIICLFRSQKFQKYLSQLNSFAHSTKYWDGQRERERAKEQFCWKQLRIIISKITPGKVSTFHLLRNLQMGPIS